MTYMIDTLTDTFQTVFLTKTEDGTIRIGKTRVTLESVVHQYSIGATPEEIAQKFPALKLAEVYAVIAYFLNNHEQVAKYILEQEIEGDIVQAKVEAEYMLQTTSLRQRIMTRWEKRNNAL